MSQRWIESIVGRLLTDEAFREDFQHDPLGTLTELVGQGTPLTSTEIAALIAIDPALWSRVAREIDSRLQKASLRSR